MSARTRTSKIKLDPLPILPINLANQPKYRNKNSSAPQWKPFRYLICGVSDSGKTYTLAQLLAHIDFDTITIYTTSPDQPIWQTIFKTIEEDEEEKGYQYSYIGTSFDDMLPISNFDYQYQNLIIFDDWLGEEQSGKGTVKQREKILSDYMKKSRPRNCSVVYLTQSFFETPKPIRTQMKYFSFYKGESTDTISRIAKKIPGCSDAKRFTNAYIYATENSTRDLPSFLTVDADNAGTELLYRKNYDEPILFNSNGTVKNSSGVSGARPTSQRTAIQKDRWTRYRGRRNDESDGTDESSEESESSDEEYLEYLKARAQIRATGRSQASTRSSSNGRPVDSVRKRR